MPPTPEPTPEPWPITFEGNGDYLSPEFEAFQGVIVLQSSHSGSDNFIVQILSADGGLAALSVNTIGDYSGTRLHTVDDRGIFGLTPGMHRVEVSADGPWEIKIDDYLHGRELDVPFTENGTGDTVIAPISLGSGIFVLDAKHGGSDNFIVTIVSEDGQSQDLLINDIGPYEGQKAIRVQEDAIIGLEPGIHALEIRADGDWSISVNR